MTKQKLLSVLGFLGMVAAIFGLLVTKNIIAQHPVFMVIQVIAILLMLWARLTFGLRSFHVSADTTRETWLPKALIGLSVTLFMRL